MTGEKHDVGYITAISDKRKNGKDKGYGVLLGSEEKKNWINFKDILPGWIEKGLYVFVTYTENKGFKNGKNITKSDPPVEAGEKPAAGNGGFKPANNIDNIDLIVGGCADVASRCIDAFEKITGNTPTTDGEWAVVNTMQIQVHKYLSSKAIVGLATKKASGKCGGEK